MKTIPVTFNLRFDPEEDGEDPLARMHAILAQGGWGDDPVGLFLTQAYWQRLEDAEKVRADWEALTPEQRRDGLGIGEKLRRWAESGAPGVIRRPRSPHPFPEHPDMDTVYIIVSGEPSDADDHFVPGFYAVRVDPGLDDTQKADATLDAFHGKVGIACLDDFTIEVRTADGALLSGAESHENGSLSDKAEYIGDFDDPAHLPEAVRAALQRKD
ncbi:hypothetical protein WV31_10110 [Magnetospirillum sp. ME-1]|uniref:hypothetical protein n=1 Tax=Magnetospirillum sp. ME-1 TaxID=1639348 RepID=UPI000A17D36D|nr:hypothetical protein [Magnetospirillum sp. ME-1]ARJ65981.1 hypothetical protein WV31_10110 [Magnetospirillum sp. ME-1]